MLNLTACRYLLEVARHRSIRLAADRLHVSPSAISRQIAKLEHEFEEQILERRADGVQLTDAGRVLADHLTIVFDQIDVAKGEISDLKKLKTGSVSVATVEGISDPFLSASITEFRKKFPAIDFRVCIRGRERVLEAVEQHLSQIGFVYDHFSHPQIEIVGQWRQPLLAMVPPGHPLVEGDKVSLQDLVSVDCVMPDDSFGIHHLIHRAFRNFAARPQPILVADQLHFLIRHAIRNNAVVYLPLQAALNEVTAGELLPLNLDCAEFEHRFIYLIVRRDQRRSPACEAFIKEIRSTFAENERADAALLARIRSDQT